jgi:hypothetical protein
MIDKHRRNKQVLRETFGPNLRKQLPAAGTYANARAAWCPVLPSQRSSAKLQGAGATLQCPTATNLRPTIQGKLPVKFSAHSQNIPAVHTSQTGRPKQPPKIC